MALERTFLFMGRSAKRTRITRVLALCGLGERLGARNWEVAKRLQKEDKALAWLREEQRSEIDLSELEEVHYSSENLKMVSQVGHFPPKTPRTPF